MFEQRTKNAIIPLQWTLGLVILTEAILFLMPAARHDFARTHMPELVRQVLGWGEIVGAVLLLIPKTAVRGAWLLIGIFILAIIVHALHGMLNVGSLLIYTASAWTITATR